MYPCTLRSIRCLECQGKLEAHRIAEQDARGDILYGEAACISCRFTYFILAGVLLYVRDLENALISHIKGLTQLVPDERIPEGYRQTYLEARESLAEDGFFDAGMEEDLEAERVNALYVMNHFLSADQIPRSGDGPIDALISQHWGKGPLEKTAHWIKTHLTQPRVLELGCSVGGLAQRLSGHAQSYLGVDSSFVSVALARHLALGAGYPRPIKIPGDLLVGPVSIAPELPPPGWKTDQADFILADVQALFLAEKSFDVSVALGLLDMLEDPGVLPQKQGEFLESKGVVIQAGPYIWHAGVAHGLLESLSASSSAEAVIALYEQSGLQLREQEDSVPWLFFKHLRQLEVYSVHWSAFHLKGRPKQLKSGRA